MSPRTPIEPSEIRVGDTVEAESFGMRTCFTVSAIKGNRVYSVGGTGDNGGFLTLNGSEWFLLDRPAPVVVLPSEPTLGWLNGDPHLLAIWRDVSETAARQPCIAPTRVPTAFDGEHIKSFTPATAVPTEALNMLRSEFDDAGASESDFAAWALIEKALDTFLAAVDSANGAAS